MYDCGLFAALFLHRQKDIKRLFSYSSIEHMGLMTFAFGIGGLLATFAALLHMGVHSLVKSAIFVTVVGYLSRVSYASCGAVSNVIPVDMMIAGCPPTPLVLMKSLLALMQNK